MTTPITPLEQRVIDAARQIDSLAEVCDLIDYDPKIGRVPAHWRVKSPLMWTINIATQQPAPQPVAWACWPDGQECNSQNMQLSVVEPLAYSKRTPLYAEQPAPTPLTAKEYAPPKDMSINQRIGYRRGWVDALRAHGIKERP